MSGIPTDHPYCFVMGDPIAHSRSPRLHTAAFRAVGLEWTYHALLVPARDPQQAVPYLRHPNFRGANVTLPHKTAVMALLDGIDPAAEAIGAVNTIVPEQGRLIGYNTDKAGFLAPLAEAGRDWSGAEALVFGDGGAAKAVVAGLTDLGMRVKIVSRRAGQSRISYAEAFGRLAGCDLLVNATPLGLPPHADASPLDGYEGRLSPTLTGYDLIYEPETTPFLKRIAEAGGTVIGGKRMFREQAAASFRLWTGRSMPKLPTE